MRVLVTGCAGFIGHAITVRLLQEGHQVYGLDNLNSYYDPKLKRDRLNRLEQRIAFRFGKVNIETLLTGTQHYSEIHDFGPDVVLHLAAQAGVRYSIENPSAYVQSNLVGFGKILELSRHLKVKHLMYASSSSVYGKGATSERISTETDPTDSPLSLYAATKKANEAMAHSYTNLYGIPTTGMRFFTVYGPWGRPDMVLFKFTKAISEGTPIQLYNYGRHFRDFTYIGDCCNAILALMGRGGRAAEIFNIGTGRQVALMDYLGLIEQELSLKADTQFLPMQPADVESTRANIDKLVEATGYMPETRVEAGVHEFVKWYQEYYRPRQ